MSEHVIGRLEDFPEGEGTEVEVDGLRIAVFNLDGELYAISGTCPHKGAPLALAGSATFSGDSDRGASGLRGSIDEGERTIGCPWHGLTFDLETGSCPAAGYRLRTFDVAVEDGTVRLTL